LITSKKITSCRWKKTPRMYHNSASITKLHRISIIQKITSVKIRFHIQAANNHCLKTHPRHSGSHSTIHFNPLTITATILWVQLNLLILKSLLSKLSLKKKSKCHHQSFNIHLFSTKATMHQEISSDLHPMMQFLWLQHIILILLPQVWNQEIHQLVVIISLKIATNRYNNSNYLQLLFSNHHS